MTAQEQISQLSGLCLTLTDMNQLGAQRTKIHAFQMDKRRQALVSVT